MKRLVGMVGLVVLAGCGLRPSPSSNSTAAPNSLSSTPIPVVTISPSTSGDGLEEVRENLRVCGDNLKTIGVALEMYSTNWNGTYPGPQIGLDGLVPNYLDSIPRCPSAGSVTYGYEHGKDVERNEWGFQDYFVIQCEGAHHEVLGVAPNEPAYDNVVGLLTDVDPGEPSPKPKVAELEAKSDYERCTHKLKNVGTALEMYSTDWRGKYPPDLAHLVPEYLESLPQCPSSGRVYEARFGPGAPGNTAGFQDYYYLGCRGSAHLEDGVSANFPQYNGIMGLVADKKR